MREKNINERKIEMDYQEIILYLGNATRRQDGNERLYQW